MSTSEFEIARAARAKNKRPEQTASEDVRLEKYNKNDETTAEEIHARVARALVAEEAPEKQDALIALYERALQSGFIPAGRVLSSSGINLKATLINCFVQQIGDWLTGTHDGIPGIYDALSQAAETLRRGGGVGYDFSRIRPKGALVAGTLSHASGPISFMKVFDESCKQIESAGSRRGAQMGVLRVDHPDIRDFVTAKSTPGMLTQFNVSVAVSQSFLDAMENGQPFDLVHETQPFDTSAGQRRASDGRWIYESINPQELWDLIMQQTYDHAEPGVLFIDQANAENNLYYCETFEATNPCAEQWLPPYGCCCLGSINLTEFVQEPFTERARFDYDGFADLAGIATRMLDSVLDITSWPLEQQRVEAFNKRRIGLGFLGLGDALCMLQVPYNSAEGLATAEKIARTEMEAAYRTSVELAKEKGPFELFDPDMYLRSKFVARLPQSIRDDIAKYGIRNSHLLSVAPTGTISLAMADNASNGIEPAFSWSYQRKKRTKEGGFRQYAVVDHAYRRYCLSHKGVDPANADAKELAQLEAELPEYFVSAHQMSALDHMNMVAAVQPYVDSSISKTVNVPVDYPFDEFKQLYWSAAKSGLKGLATYRPNDITGAVLSVESHAEAEATTGEITLDQHDADRRLRLEKLPLPILNSLRWPKRPKLPNGNPAWTYVVKTEDYHFAIFIGYTQNGTAHPFEVWVNGSEQPRGLGAIAKALSMDLRSNDRAFVQTKLASLERSKGDDGFELEMPPRGELTRVPSLVSGFAKIIKHCIAELEQSQPGISTEDAGVTDLIGDPVTPMMDALMSPREPKTSADGTMAWAVDIRNHQTGDDFVLYVKELVMPNGQRRPCSVWMSGVYPKTFDGLCKVLSFDMRIIDAAWIGAKLRSLSDFAEPQGDFLASSPGGSPGGVKQASFPSTVSYVCRLLIHRYAMLGILDEQGYPVEEAGLMDDEYHNIVRLKRASEERKANIGRLCTECNTYALIRKDNCDFCEACGALGTCG
jgi:ribonucleoside-diphosphate reductase alpha chain